MVKTPFSISSFLLNFELGFPPFLPGGKDALHVSDTDVQVRGHAHSFDSADKRKFRSRGSLSA